MKVVTGYGRVWFTTFIQLIARLRPHTYTRCLKSSNLVCILYTATELSNQAECLGH